jgi:hypothetical protein
MHPPAGARYHSLIFPRRHPREKSFDISHHTPTNNRTPHLIFNVPHHPSPFRTNTTTTSHPLRPHTDNEANPPHHTGASSLKVPSTWPLAGFMSVIAALSLSCSCSIAHPCWLHFAASGCFACDVWTSIVVLTATSDPAIMSSAPHRAAHLVFRDVILGACPPNSASRATTLHSAPLS